MKGHGAKLFECNSCFLNVKIILKYILIFHFDSVIETVAENGIGRTKDIIGYSSQYLLLGTFNHVE